MKVEQKKAGIVLGYVSEGVKILTKLFYTPVMLHLLGNSEYGLYDLVNSVVSYLGLLSLGFGSAYMRFYSRIRAKNDEDEIARLNGMFLTIFTVIAVICLLCGTVMTFHTETIFKTGLTEAEIEKSKVLMVIMVINMALTFPNTVFNNIITAHERFVFQKGLTLFQAILNPFLSLPLLIMGYGSVGLVVLTTCLTLVVLISDMVYCFATLKIKFCFRGFRLTLFKEMFIFTCFLFLNQIIDQINWSVDRYLLGRIINTTAVAIYGMGALLNSMYIEMSKSVSSVFVPQVNRIVAEDNDNQKLTSLFIKVGRIQFMILLLIMTGIIFFGQSFFSIWVGDGYESSYYVAILLMIPETVPLIQNIGIEIQFARNMHQTRSVVYFIMAMMNILISIPLIKVIGVIGATVGTAVSLVVGNILFMNWYYHSRIGLDIIRFWRSILSLCKGLVFPVIVGSIILLFANTGRLSSFLMSVIFYSIIYIVSMWISGMNIEEKNQIVYFLGKFKVRG